MLRITGVLPFTETIFLWQSMVMAVVLMAVSILICWVSTPTGDKAVTAEMLGVDPSTKTEPLPPQGGRATGWNTRRC